MKELNKVYYTIDDIEKHLSEKYIVKKYRKLADAYPNRDEWMEDYDDVLLYTDGVINSENYCLFVTKEREELEGSLGYNEIFLQCDREENIPDRMFILDASEKSGSCVCDMVNHNIDYFSASEKKQ